MTETDDPRAAFIESALWHGPLEPAKAILNAHPEIAKSDIHVSAILGDDAAVKGFLQIDPGNATAKGGPRGWDALTHLCFSKFLRLDRARSNGFLAAATALLDAGADPNSGFFDPSHQPVPTFESVLYGAAGVAHHAEMTRLLLERGANPNDDEVPYHSPETLDNRTIEVLVESGKLTPDSLLTMAIRKLDWHDYDGVEYLLTRGTDPNRLGHWGSTLLHHALGRANPISFFELLLRHGADPALLSKEGTTALSIAARIGRGDVLDLFYRHGFKAALSVDDAFLAACARADEAVAVRIAADDPNLIPRLVARNNSLLVDFAGSGNTAAVRLMLDLGVDIAAQRTTPSWAAGETALHVAAWRGYLPMARLLIERGAPLEARNRSGATPLGAALQALVEQSEWTPNENSIEIADALLKAGAKTEPEGLTLAAALCLGRMDDAVQLAQTAGEADLHLALEAAAINGKVEAIAFLIQRGVNVNEYNTRVQYHATPLHNAASSGSLDAVKMLVAAGANIQAKDTAYDATPLTWAQYHFREEKNKKQYAEIVTYLEEKAGTTGP